MLAKRRLTAFGLLAASLYLLVWGLIWLAGDRSFGVAWIKESAS